MEVCDRLGQWFRCEQKGLCGKECTATFAQTLHESDLKLLSNDAYEQGYFLTAVEQTIVYLNNLDLNVKINGLKRSWKKVLGKQIVQPFLLSKKPSRKWHLRASEWGCDLARIIAKLDQEKICSELGIKIDDRLARIGKIAHALRNQQHVNDFIHNLTLDKIGFEPVPRWSYCEKTIEYVLVKGGHELVVRGTADVLLQFGDALGALDFKRFFYSEYEKNSHTRQKMIYAAGLAQMECYDKVFGVLSRRPFKARVGIYRPEKFSITFADERLMKKIDDELWRSYFSQAELLHQANAALEYKKAKEVEKRGCINYTVPLRECFVRPICESLLARCDRCLIEVIDDLKVSLPDCILPYI